MLLSSTNPSAAQLDRDAGGDRRIWFRLVTPEVDTAGTITLPMGVDLTRFRRRPVFLWHHPLPGLDPEAELPPPDPEDVLGRVIEIEQSEQALDILVEFAPGEINPRAELCCRMVQAGFLGAVSWGGNILRKEDRPLGEGAVVPVITAVDLFEASLVIVGANPGAQALERAIRALTPRRAPGPPAAAQTAAAPGPRTSSAEPPPAERQPPSTKRGSMERDEFHSKLGLPADCADKGVASKALKTYMSTTADNAEQRGMMQSAFDAHYSEGGEGAAKEGGEGEGDKPADDKEKPEPAEKAGEGDDLDKEEDPETLRAAVRMAQRAAQVRAAAPAVRTEAVIAAEVDRLIEDGQVERDPERRKEAIRLHTGGKLLPALRAAGIKPGTFTTSQRLRGGRVGTETELATRAAGGGPARREAPAVETPAERDPAADAKAVLKQIHDVNAAGYLPATNRS